MLIDFEFREKVDRAAKSVATNSNAFDWEDISQSMWVWFLENPTQYAKYVSMEDPFRELKKVAKQEVYKANNAWEWYSGNYTYTPGEVRGLLGEYLFEATLESISEHVDLVEGLIMLRSDAPSYFKVVIDKWVHGEEGNTGRTTEAVSKLTVLMNQVNKAARYSYEGPGSRKVLTNSQASAQREQE
jgi:hypothetical protein